MFHDSGSWNAVLFRFVSCARSDDVLTGSVRRHGTSPAHPERFYQEEALFNFFVNGLSVLESFFYGLYWIGSMVDIPSQQPTRNSPSSVSPERACEAEPDHLNLPGAFLRRVPVA
jgi:hypothetical protein